MGNKVIGYLFEVIRTLRLPGLSIKTLLWASFSHRRFILGQPCDEVTRDEYESQGCVLEQVLTQLHSGFLLSTSV